MCEFICRLWRSFQLLCVSRWGIIVNKSTWCAYESSEISTRMNLMLWHLQGASVLIWIEKQIKDVTFTQLFSYIKWSVLLFGIFDPLDPRIWLRCKLGRYRVWNSRRFDILWVPRGLVDSELERFEVDMSVLEILTCCLRFYDYLNPFWLELALDPNYKVVDNTNNYVSIKFGLNPSTESRGNRILRFLCCSLFLIFRPLSAWNLRWAKTRKS